MPIPAPELNALFQKAFPDSHIELVDLAGDNDHYKVAITSPQFKGLSRVAQHRLVQRALDGVDLHALAIETKIAP